MTSPTASFAPASSNDSPLPCCPVLDATRPQPTELSLDKKFSRNLKASPASIQAPKARGLHNKGHTEMPLNLLAKPAYAYSLLGDAVTLSQFVEPATLEASLKTSLDASKPLKTFEPSPAAWPVATPATIPPL
jgi:hypothetical protein